MRRLFTLVLLLTAFSVHSREYLFFLHNRFLELAKPGEEHPDYGLCEYDQIITSFKTKGFTVISERRPADTDGEVYARKVVRQVDSLISKCHVAPSDITVVGTSKGGYIAQLVSGYLKNPQVNFVFVGCCDPEMSNNPDIQYYGNILSIYERSDKWQSCQKMKELSGTNVTRFNEIELSTGLVHGYLYKALDQWMIPAVKWAHRQYDALAVNDMSAQLDSVLTTGTLPFSGLIVIEQNGRTRYTHCSGYAHADSKRAIRFSDRFVIGSISKQMTAVLALREYDRGTLKLHVPVGRYLPQLKYNWADSVTIHHLLSHTHGINEDDPAQKLQFAPGSGYKYSQYGYQLLAMILEEVTHKSFSSLVDSLFRQCGMNNSYYPVANDTTVVNGYIADGKSTRLRNKNEYLAERLVPAGGFISTAPDLVKWNQHLYHGKLLKPKTFALMTQPKKSAVRQHPIFGPTAYGYGTTVSTTGVKQFGQTGGVPGYATMNFFLPETNTSVIMLCNLWDAQDLKKTFHRHAAILEIVKAAINDF